MDSDYISPYLFNLPKQEDNFLDLDWSSLLQDQITSPYGSQLNHFAFSQPQNNIFQYSNNYDQLMMMSDFYPPLDFEFPTPAAAPLLEVGNHYNETEVEERKTCQNGDGAATTATATDFVQQNGDDGGNNRSRANKRMSCCNLEYEEIQKYFHVPISRAAKELKVGLTVLKRRCRELNIMRWPHRKMKSLESLIKNVQEMGLTEELARLEQHKQLLALLPDMELTERTKKLRQACFKANYKKRRASSYPHLLC